jgi:hypothetical protein
MAENDRVLIEIMTAANLQGVEQASQSFMGLNIQTAALIFAIGALVEIGKQSIANTKAHEQATNDLAQAAKTQGVYFGDLDRATEGFIETNKAFISNQYDAKESMAEIVRAGNDQGSALRMLNDALDLSAIKHESMTDAAKTLILAEAGSGRGLRDLGITTEEYNKIMKSKLSQQEKDAELLTLIETKTAHGRDTTDKLSQSQYKLNKDWQDFTEKVGPAVLWVLDQVATAADTGVQILTELANVVEAIAQSPGKLGTALDVINRDINPFAGSVGATPAGRRHRATGGPVYPGTAYTVGEQGPETLVMGSQGGYISPGGAGNTITIYVSGAVGAEETARAIARQLRAMSRD